MKIFGNIIFFVLFGALSAFSQTNLTLSGILTDKSSHEPVFSGTVQLLRAKDSVYVDGAISDDKGVFTLQNLKSGNYILKVTYIGYLTLFKNVNLNGAVPVTRLGEIPLEANDVLLKETVVEGKRPEITVKNDTMEYDAASYKVTEDAVVEDLLKKLPGVEVDKDGKVTAQGKSVNKMYVNGKEFFRDDPQVATKNIPADIVDKVQVYDRKSDMAQMTGFDNGDEETVINLTVRSNMMQGTIGTVQIGAGRDVQNDKDMRYSERAFVRHQQGSDSYSGIISLNNNNNMGGADFMGAGGGGGGRGGGGNPSGITRAQNYMFNINKDLSPQLTLNGDIRFGKQDRKTLSNVSQTTFSDVRPQQETTNQNIFNAGNNFNTNLRIDWNPNKQHALIFRPTVRVNQTDRNGLMYDERINLNNQKVTLDSKSLTSSHGNTTGFGGSLDYSFKFPKEGRVFSISASGNYNNNYSQPKNKTFYRSNPLDNDYTLLYLNQIAENKSLTNNFGATFSYVEPIGHNNFIQLLYRYSYSETESKNSTYNILKDFSDDSDIAAFDTAMIVPSQSRTILRNATDQRFGLNFKADRKKYNLTFGFNVNPSKATNETYQPSAGILTPQLIPTDFSGKLPIFKGDSLISSIPIDVVNYSPTVNFRYKFDQRSNLRVFYDGATGQPSADQLRDYPYVDINRPNDVTIGNPNLKPSYTNNLQVEFNKYVQATQLTYRFSVNGSYTVNDIITITQVQANGGNTTTYQNINGNWGASLRGMINIPLSKKFSIGEELRYELSDDNSFVGSGGQQVKNKMQSRMIRDALNLKLQLNDSLYIGTTGTINYNNVVYSATPQQNQNIYDYAWGANILWTFLPGWTFDSDINRTWRSGYPTGYNVTQTLWNAAITKRLFKKQYGTGSIKLQVFDILQDRKNIFASQTASKLQFSQTNVIPSYFMASFIYRFSVFPKSSFLKEGDMAPQRRGGERDGGGRPPGGDFGGRGFGGGERPF